MAWGSYYRNVICIARSVGVGGNLLFERLQYVQTVFGLIFFIVLNLALLQFPQQELTTYVCYKKITVKNATVNW